MKSLHFLLIAVCSFFICYLATAYLYLNTNPATWDKDLRTNAIIAWIITMFITVAIYFREQEIKENKEPLKIYGLRLFFLFALCYFCISFVNMQFNLLLWKYPLRVTFVYAWTILSFVGCVMYVIRPAKRK